MSNPTDDVNTKLSTSSEQPKGNLTNVNQPSAVLVRPTNTDLQEGGQEGQEKDTVSKFKEATDLAKEKLMGAVGSGKKDEGASKEAKDEPTIGEVNTQEEQGKEGEQKYPSQKQASKLAATLSTAGAPVFVESDNVVDLIVDDHNKAKKLFEEYKKTDSITDKKAIANELIRTLVSHDECEQLLVYPLLKENIGGVEKSHQLYEKSLAEHQDHRELLYEVKNTDIHKDYDKFDSKLKEAMEAVIHHVKEEEAETLPLLQKHLSEAELKKVGASFRAHKPLCPTYPHPKAPQSGFPAAAASIILKPFDALRDFAQG